MLTVNMCFYVMQTQVDSTRWSGSPRKRAALVRVVVAPALVGPVVAAAFDVLRDGDDALVHLVLLGSDDAALRVGRDAAVLVRGLAQHHHAVVAVAAHLGAADRGLARGVHSDPLHPAFLDDTRRGHASPSGGVYPGVLQKQRAALVDIHRPVQVACLHLRRATLQHAHVGVKGKK